MSKQRRLAFAEEEQLERLWQALPESARRAVTQNYARLMARTAVQRIRQLHAKQGADDEPDNR